MQAGPCPNWRQILSRGFRFYNLPQSGTHACVPVQVLNSLIINMQSTPSNYGITGHRNSWRAAVSSIKLPALYYIIVDAVHAGSSGTGRDVSGQLALAG